MTEASSVSVGDQIAPDSTRRSERNVRSRRRRLWWLVGGTVVVTVLGAAAFFLWQAQAVEVEVGSVTATEFAVTVSASGKVAAEDPVDVYTKNQGIVSKVLVREGQQVALGQPLLEMDNAALKAQLLQAQSGLAQAQGGLAQAQNGADSQAAGIKAAQAGLDAAKKGLSAAQELKRLADEGVTTAQAFLDDLNGYPIPDLVQIALAELTVGQAKASQQQAARGVAQAQGAVASARGALAQAQAGDPSATIGAANVVIASAQEQVTLAKQALKDAVITAPVAGMVLFAPTAATAQSLAAGGSPPVSGATLMTGSVITPGVALFTIVDTGRMRFVAEVDERDITRLSLDQSATVTLDSFADRAFAGVVSRISPKTQTTMTGGTVFLVDILLDSADERLAIGMKGDAHIQVSRQKNATTIPLQALFSEGGNDYVYVIVSRRLVKTAVTIGEKTDTAVEVKSGLQIGQQLALAGNVPYADNLRIRMH